ncbi:MAG TPA: hypothetical protein VKW78_17020 [Terriglobales bacterium]|nr:hypothetical protein [Terriglobales bacterium]
MFDLATVCAPVTPASAIRDTLIGIPEIEQVFLEPEGERGISVLVVIDKKDYPTQRRIFEKEIEIGDSFPAMEISFSLVIRDGRPLRDVVSPRGTVLFAREALAHKSGAY